MDEILRDLYRKWQASNDQEDAFAYLRILLRSGNSFELTDYPLDLLKEFVAAHGGIALPNVTLRGKPIFPEVDRELSALTLDKSLNPVQRRAALQALQRILQVTTWPDEDDYWGLNQLFEMAEALEANNYSRAVVWYPRKEDSQISIYCAAQGPEDYENLASLVEISESGEIDKRRLENLPGPEGFLVEFIFNPISGHIENFLNHTDDEETRQGFWTGQKYMDHYFGRNYHHGNNLYEPFLILSNDIDPTKFQTKTPTVSYGRCEDFPACGHDICPPNVDGVQIAMVCVCGKFLPIGRSSSLCDACLRDPDDPARYDRDPYEDEDEEEESEDEDEDEDEDEEPSFDDRPPPGLEDDADFYRRNPDEDMRQAERALQLERTQDNLVTLAKIKRRSGDPIVAEADNLKDWIQEQLVEANRRRRVRTLDFSDAITDLQIISDRYDASRVDFSFTLGGTVTASAYRYPSYTTVVFVGRASDVIRLGIAECNAHHATPGRCWRLLQPWRDNKEIQFKNTERWVLQGTTSDDSVLMGSGTILTSIEVLQQLLGDLP